MSALNEANDSVSTSAMINSMWWGVASEEWEGVTTSTNACEDCVKRSYVDSGYFLHVHEIALTRLQQ